jgi:3-hydroxyisobutyrate dehydrogenase
MANAEVPLLPGRTIGFIGLGHMGLPMARRIAAAGYALQALDARPGIAAELARECGAIALSSAVDFGADLDAVILMLPDGHAVRRVLLDDGLAQRLGPAAVVIDMGSSDPIGTLELAARLAKLSVHMVDAPVSGGVPRALTGELTIMAGGEPALVERCRPLLATMGSRILATGKLGSGQAMKSLNNFVSAVGMVAAVEAVNVAQRFGLDPMVAAEVLNGSTGKNNTTEHKLRQFILSRSFASGFSLDLMAKDLGIAASLSRHTGSQAILLDWCLSFWQAAQTGLGRGLDHTEIARWIETVIQRDPPSH